MHKYWYIIVFCYFSSAFGQSAVTPSDYMGRLGDNLIHYLHAKWLAYEHQVDLYYRPFPYSSELVLHTKEIQYRPELVDSKRFITIQNGSQMNCSDSCLYIVPYFPEETHQYVWHNMYFDVNWKDEMFLQIVREMIAPIRPLTLTYPPSGVISVAVHVREGGGADPEFPPGFNSKMPAFDFYVTGLRHILSVLPDRPIYCHIFTDAVNPASIAEMLQEAVPVGKDVQFGWRREGNHHSQNVLEDFFSLFNFQVLLRPESNFSIVPSLLHDYALVYHPLREEKNKDRFGVTVIEAQIDTHPELYPQLFQ